MKTSVDEIKTKYEPRIINLLQKWGRECEEAGCPSVSEVLDLSGDCYKWAIRVERPDGVIVDIDLELMEASVHEGEGVEGVNWYSSIVEEGGRILGIFSPYNYTAQCWTTDDAEIARRFEMMEDLEEVSDNALLPL